LTAILSFAPPRDVWSNVPGGSAISVGQDSQIQLRNSASRNVEFEIESGTAKF
jgi:hypothetical protein